MSGPIFVWCFSSIFPLRYSSSTCCELELSPSALVGRGTHAAVLYCMGFAAGVPLAMVPSCWDGIAGEGGGDELLTLARTVSLPTFDASLSQTIFRQTVGDSRAEARAIELLTEADVLLQRTSSTSGCRRSG